jgi:hypothetical protein
MSADTSSSGSNKSDLLKSLRQELTDSQRKILNWIWENYLPEGSWPTRRSFNLEFYNETDHIALTQLGGSIVFENNDNGRNRLRLSFLGALLTKDGVLLEDLLSRCIRYMLDRLNKEPELQQVSSSEAVGALELKGYELYWLIRFMPLNPAGVVRQHGQGTWHIGPRYDMDNIHTMKDITRYIHEQALLDYDPQMPIGENGRVQRYLQLQYDDRLKQTASQQNGSSSMDIFISHSSKDVKIAEALIDLIKIALGTPSERIRCSSVNGYRFPTGSSTDQAIRQDVVDAKAFIGLITPSSLQSAYVMFELGARWGLNKPFYPLFASGADGKILSGPLVGLNVLNCEDQGQVTQFLGDLAKELDAKIEAPAVYLKHVAELIKASRKQGRAPRTRTKPQPTQESPLPDLGDLIAELEVFITTPEDWHGRSRSFLTIQYEKLSGNGTLDRLPKDVRDALHAAYGEIYHINKLCGAAWTSSYNARVEALNEVMTRFRKDGKPKAEAARELLLSLDQKL